MSQVKTPVDQKISPHAGNSTLYNVYLLGRWAFTMEPIFWALLGSVLFYAKYHQVSAIAAVSSTGVVFLTNLSINYANEYFDFEADKFHAEINLHGSHGGSKMLIDGTFPRWVALACAAVLQGLILVWIAISRSLEGERSAFQGTALWLGLCSMVASQQYVGPPLRIHYNGGGELISSMAISSLPVVFGFLAQRTTLLGRGLDLQESWDLFSPAMRLFLGWTFTFELARIYIMHAADITEDRLAKKHTLVSILGYGKTKTVYELTCFINLFLAWNLVLENRKAACLLVPIAAYAIPIALDVRKKLHALIPEDIPGKLGFAQTPILVSIETLATPVVCIIATGLFGDCLA